MNIHMSEILIGGLKIFCEVYLRVEVPVDGTQESIMLIHMGICGTEAA